MEQPEEEELNDDGLSESDRIKLEHAMLDIAYENAYALLTGQTTFEGLLHDKAMEAWAKADGLGPADDDDHEEKESKPLQLIINIGG